MIVAACYFSDLLKKILESLDLKVTKGRISGKCAQNNEQKNKDMNNGAIKTKCSLEQAGQTFAGCSVLLGCQTNRRFEDVTSGN